MPRARRRLPPPRQRRPVEPVEPVSSMLAFWQGLGVARTVAGVVAAEVVGRIEAAGAGQIAAVVERMPAVEVEKKAQVAGWEFRGIEVVVSWA